MVKELQKVDTILYVCAICRAAYPQKDWAEKCEEWCETHDGSSNPKVTQHAVPLKEDKQTD